MSAIGSTRYRLLGWAAWHGARWYLRRRPSARRLALLGVLAGGALLGAAILSRRPSD
jgi:hypothetical protein